MTGADAGLQVPTSVDNLFATAESSGRRRRWWRRLTILAGLLGLATAAVLVLVPRSPTFLAPTWTVEGITDYLVRPDTLYATAADPLSVTAYNPTTGAVRWSSPIPADGTLVDLHHGVLALVAGRVGAERSTFLDEASGRLLSEASGAAKGMIPGTTLVLAVASDASGGCTDGCAVAAVDLVTGAAAWKIDIPAGTIFGWSLAGPAGVLVTVQGASLTTVDLGTGATIHRVTLPAGTALPARYPQAVRPVSVGSAVILTARTTDGSQDAQAAAVDLATGALRWTTVLPPLPAARVISVDSCGGLICVGRPGSINGLDPDTGNLRLDMMAVDVTTVGNMLLANTDPGVRILDPTSFAPIAQVDRVNAIGAVDGRPGFLGVRTFFDYDELVAVDPTGSVTVLGRTDRSICGAGAGVIACSVGTFAGHTLRVWRIPG